MTKVRAFTSEFDEYRKDESRSVGQAESISFPENEEDVCHILKQLYKDKIPITLQGGRTGLAAAAVPGGGHVMNLSKMNQILGLRQDDGKYTIRVQPGVVLSALQKGIESKRLEPAAWTEGEQKVYEAFCQEPEHFFPTDPTETSACLGGMAACNASGARSYYYGAMRSHVTGLRVALSDGSMLCLRRGENFAKGRKMRLTKEEGGEICLELPLYQMPHTKNASGYYVCDNMDAIDLFIGSDGTLGVLTELELELLPLPVVIWGISCFFRKEKDAIAFTRKVREEIGQAAAIEFFDGGAIEILRRQKARGTAFSSLLDVDAWVDCCIYVELHCETQAEALDTLYRLGEILEAAGGKETETWVARNANDREQQQFFRHAVPESTNMLIDDRKKIDSVITKLGADMSVPDEYLDDVVEMYRRSLKEYDLESATWGHIGNNHLHVNILPRDGEDYRKGKELYAIWAKAVTKMGGAVSAEHGVGKLKRAFLEVMYGREHIMEMARLKRQLDPHFIFGRGNLFPGTILEEGEGKEV